VAERSKAQGANPVGPGFRELGPEGSNPSLSAYFPKRLPIPDELKLGSGDGLPVLHILGNSLGLFLLPLLSTRGKPPPGLGDTPHELP
jgi:hypothetical protein